MERTNREAFNFLADGKHEVLIYGVLKSLHLTKYDDNYDDYVQEARITFVKAYVTYPKSIEEDEQKFMNHAFTAVKWRILDLLNRRNRKQDHSEFSMDNELLPDEVKENIIFDASSHQCLEDQIINDDFFQHLFRKASQNERNYLIGVILKHQTLVEIAAEYGISRQAVNKWQSGVRSLARQMAEKER